MFLESWTSPIIPILVLGWRKLGQTWPICKQQAFCHFNPYDEDFSGIEKEALAKLMELSTAEEAFRKAEF